MRRWIMLLLACSLGVLATGCTSGGTDARSASTSAPVVSRLDPAQFSAIMQEPATKVIDVRTPEEFADGHLDGATNMDIYSSDFAQRIDGLDRTGNYAVYCRSGNRSLAATHLMVDSGFSTVSDLKGGINAWIAAGLPVVQ